MPLNASICLDLSNSIDICNNKFIFNNNYQSDISYGIFQTGIETYKINNISKYNPIGFYSNQINDISNIIKYELYISFISHNFNPSNFNPFFYHIYTNKNRFLWSYNSLV